MSAQPFNSVESYTWDLPRFKSVSPRRMLLWAALDQVVGELRNRSRGPGGIVLYGYEVNSAFPIWEICATRNAPGVPSPNCMLLALGVDDTRISFTILPFRHTFPDEPSRIAWGWCGNLFLARRLIHYAELEPFFLKEKGEFQYTSDQEIRAFLATSEIDENEFKSSRRLYYRGIPFGERVEPQIDLEWQAYHTLYRHRIEEMRKELSLIEQGEALTFPEAARALVALLERLSPAKQLMVVNVIPLNHDVKTDA